MLATASAAIREACPSMLVISGAPTPAGNVANLAVDDFVYMQQMLEAGMANHVDGIGAHLQGYNVPPHATLGRGCAAIQGPAIRISCGPATVALSRLEFPIHDGGYRGRGRP